MTTLTSQVLFMGAKPWNDLLIQSVSHLLPPESHFDSGICLLLWSPLFLDFEVRQRLMERWLHVWSRCSCSACASVIVLHTVALTVRKPVTFSHKMASLEACPPARYCSSFHKWLRNIFKAIIYSGSLHRNNVEARSEGPTNDFGECITAACPVY